MDKNIQANLDKKKQIKRKKRTSKHSSLRVYGLKWVLTVWWIAEGSQVIKC